MQNFSIHFGCAAEKIDKNIPFNEYGDDEITENFTASFDTCCDRSDLSQLNTEHQDGNLIIVEEIKPSKSDHYTHIVNDSYGHYYAVRFEEGNWLDRYL